MVKEWLKENQTKLLAIWLLIISVMILVPNLTFNTYIRVHHFREDKKYSVLINYRTENGQHKPIDIVGVKNKTYKRDDGLYIKVKVPLKHYRLHRRDKLYYELIL